MTEFLAINDMSVLPLTRRGGVLTVVSEDDPLLRRFGQVDYVHLPVGQTQAVWRARADEIWALVSGEAALKMEDRRQESPSFQAEQTLELTGDQPKAVLVPFGVHCLLMARSEAILVRITTHADHTDPQDLTL